MPHKPRVAVVYLSYYHNDDFTRRAFLSLAKQTYRHELLHLYVVNNPHQEFGSYLPHLQFLVDQTPDMIATTLIGTEQNLGYSGGNNVGLQRAVAEGYDYLVILNDDAFFAPDCIDAMVTAMEEDSSIAAAQPIIALYPDTHLVNSAGNALHVLGFGYSLGYKLPVDSYAQHGVHNVSYVSGALAMFRAPLLRELGYMEEAFFMYHEDTELSLRYALRGYRTVCVQHALGYHAYHFLRNKKSLEWMERNRYAVLLLTYKLPTLFLLLPALVGTEIALLFFAWRGGWLKEKLYGTGAWFKPATWRTWLPKRAHLQRTRTVRDAALLERVTGAIEFQEHAQQHWLVRRVANPVLGAYLSALKAVVRW